MATTASDQPADWDGWLARAPDVVAPALLGALLVSELGGQRVAIRITEVEAYGGIGEDPGSHAHRGETARNASMFGPPGRAYVYFIYGMHWCLNVVAHESGRSGAVLIRAGGVVEGVQAARARRPAARTDRDLARGPARLAAALGVAGEQDGVDLLGPDSSLRLEVPPEPWAGSQRISAGPRTGVPGAGAGTPWRFWVRDDPAVSPHRKARSQA